MDKEIVDTMPIKTPIPVKIFAFVAFAIFLCSCEEHKAEVEDFTHLDPATLAVGDTVTPFRFINPKEHNWRIVIPVSGEDLVDVSHKLTTRMFSTTNEEVIHRIRKWKFIYRRKGVTDASSTIRIFKNDELQDTYGIVLEKKLVRIQSKELGVLESVRHDELLDILKEMN